MTLSALINTWRSHRWTLNLFFLGGAHALAFAPGPLPGWSLPVVQVVCLALLAYAVFGSTRTRQAALRAFAFGLGSFSVGLYWLYTSMHVYGGMHPAPAGLAVLALAGFLALYGSAAAALTHWLFAYRHADHNRLRAMVLGAALFASSWTLFEWFRGTLFTGFPWLNIGYAHIDGMLSGWAPLLGVYGVAWIAAFIAAGMALFAQARQAGNDSKAAAALGVGLVIGFSGLALGSIHWTHDYGNRLIVRLVQGNVPQSLKFDPAHLQKGLETYMHLAALPPKEANGAPAIIILPETVIPLLQNRIPAGVWERWIDIARQRQATLILGAPLAEQTDGKPRYSNSAIAISADTTPDELLSARLAMRYDKHHLVPFGEFVPTGFRWFVEQMNIPLGDFHPGPLDQAPFAVAGQRLAPNICYEDVFGEELLAAVTASNNATLLVNLSNLAWFGDSWAVRQHLHISRMRARETGRPMLRATNTGMTAAIDPNGKVRAVLAPNALGVLDVEVQGTTGLTPYARWGNNPVLLLSAMVLGFSSGRRKRPVETTP
ncbi:MAG: apolipoprotein N-acyltransferase [Alcaligenaceae bacterium]|nr:apolipoprotein N-acyltransferase [Alcaligenaceae bacterium]